jgi:glycosidase
MLLSVPRRIVLLIVCAFAAAAACGQTVALHKCDPPNWWTGLPSPMLLLQGDGLGGAKFEVSGDTGARITKSEISANGHWAFVWLDTSSAHPGTVLLRASTATGAADWKLPLTARAQDSAGGFAGFSRDDVMYAVMPDRFANGDATNDEPAVAGTAPALKTHDRAQPHMYHGGDLRGILQHLDYLQELGVTTVWLMPVVDNTGNRSGGSYHGYGATDFYAVDPHLGTLADYQQLSAALHARGMKLVFDAVPNHTGPGHIWLTDPPTPTWFHGTWDPKARAWDHIDARSELARTADPHGADRDTYPERNGWFAWVLGDLNQGDPRVTEYLTDNMLWWIETARLDGIRIDTFPYADRTFWSDYLGAIHATYPQFKAVGEIFNGDPDVTASFAGGAAHEFLGQRVDTHLDTPFDFPFYITLRDVLLHGKPMTAFPDMLRHDWEYPHPEDLPIFEGNHDTQRFLWEPGSSPALLKMAFALMATVRGMPQIYAGDEIAMTGGNDPDNRRDFPGGWPEDRQNAFTTQGRTPAQAAMHDYVQNLLRIRREQPALRQGRMENLFSDATAWAFTRTLPSHDGGNRVLVVANKSLQPRVLKLDLNRTTLDGTTRLRDLEAAQTAPLRVKDNVAVVQVGPRQVKLFAAE